jgi:hypothetical protein
MIFPDVPLALVTFIGAGIFLLVMIAAIVSHLSRVSIKRYTAQFLLLKHFKAIFTRSISQLICYAF